MVRTTLISWDKLNPDLPQETRPRRRVDHTQNFEKVEILDRTTVSAFSVDGNLQRVFFHTKSHPITPMRFKMTEPRPRIEPALTNTEYYVILGIR